MPKYGQTHEKNLLDFVFVLFFACFGLYKIKGTILVIVPFQIKNTQFLHID